MSNSVPVDPNNQATAQDEIKVTTTVSPADYAVGTDTISIVITNEPTI